MELARTRSLVLLVDDSPTQSRRSAEALEVAGFRVRLARNGREALEDARRWRPDVIVSVNGQPTRTRAQFRDALRKVKPGDVVTLQVLSRSSDSPNGWVGRVVRLRAR